MKNKKLIFFSAVFLVFTVILIAAIDPRLAQAVSTDKDVYGYVEKVVLLPQKIEMKAKLDSGAKTSSLHAEEIERFEKDGQEWVRFYFSEPLDDDDDPEDVRRVMFEREISRNVRIKDDDQESDRRAVVYMEVCIGSKKIRAEFSLNDRSVFLYPMLIGRNILNEIGLVDTSKTFTHDPDCEE